MSGLRLGRGHRPTARREAHEPEDVPNVGKGHKALTARLIEVVSVLVTPCRRACVSMKQCICPCVCMCDES